MADQAHIFGAAGRTDDDQVLAELEVDYTPVAVAVQLLLDLRSYLGREARILDPSVSTVARTTRCRGCTMADHVHVALKAAIEVPTHRYLWTPSDGIDFVPRVCSKVFGDGRALLALSTLNDRPRFYVIRIDSAWNVEDSAAPDDAPDLREHLDDIYDALIDEFGDGGSHEDDGNELEGWPAFDGENGSFWRRRDWPRLQGFEFEAHPFARGVNVLKGQQVRRIEFRYLDLPAELPRARRMSFFLTTRQILERTKTVTRRNVSTWTALKPGDRLIAIEKGQGLKAGEGHIVLALLEVVDVRVEQLDDITAADCAREGFPELTPAEFCAFYRRQA